MKSLPKAAVPAVLDVALDTGQLRDTQSACGMRWAKLRGEGVATSGKQRPTESLPSAQLPYVACSDERIDRVTQSIDDIISMIARGFEDVSWFLWVVQASRNRLHQLGTRVAANHSLARLQQAIEKLPAALTIGACSLFTSRSHSEVS